MSLQNGNDQRIIPDQEDEEKAWFEEHYAAKEIETKFQSDFHECVMANTKCPDPPNKIQLAKEKGNFILNTYFYNNLSLYFVLPHSGDI